MFDKTGRCELGVRIFNTYSGLTFIMFYWPGLLTSVYRL